MRKSLFLTIMLLGGTAVASAQTADPMPPVTPLNVPGPAAVPAARAGSYAVVNGELVVAPGLRIPNGNTPWTLDAVEGKQVLIPIHHADYRAQAGSATGSIDGAASRTAVHSPLPVFFVHAGGRTENTGDSGRSAPTGWALVPLTVEGNTRRLTRPKFAEVSGATVCAAPVICAGAEALPDGWLRLYPKAPLANGEYALLPVPRAVMSAGNTLVYDFTVDGQLPSPKDTVSPGQNLDAPRKKR